MVGGLYHDYKIHHYTGATEALPKIVPELGGSGHFNSFAFQTSLRCGANLAALADSTAFEGNTSGYGFGADSPEASFFMIGTYYSQAMAYVLGGEMEKAAERLKVVEQEFIALSAPSSLYSYLGRIRNLAETKRYSTEVMADFLAALQPFINEFAATKGEQNKTLFTLGAWMNDLSMAAADRNASVIGQLANLKHIHQMMVQLDAPRGVIEALEVMVTAFTAESFTGRDFAALREAISRIQQILS